MNLPPFTISEVLQKGWKLTKENIGFLIVYQIILYAIALMVGGIHENEKWTLWYLLGYVITVIIKMGLYHSTLLITAGIKPGFDQLYANWRKFFSWVISSFIFGVLLLIGLILLIVPGCYVLAKYGFFPFFILDKDSGPLEALKLSGQATEGIRWPVFLLFLATIGINVLGLLFFGIGLLVTVPLTLLALAIVYRRLTFSNQAQIVNISSQHE